MKNVSSAAIRKNQHFCNQQLSISNSPTKRSRSLDDFGSAVLLHPYSKRGDQVFSVGHVNCQVDTPSACPFSSSVVMRKKNSSLRFCGLSRVYNVNVSDKYPISVIQRLLNELCGCTYLSKIDLRSGNHQIRVHAEDILKITFRTDDGHDVLLMYTRQPGSQSIPAQRGSREGSHHM